MINVKSLARRVSNTHSRTFDLVRYESGHSSKHPVVRHRHATWVSWRAVIRSSILLEFPFALAANFFLVDLGIRVALISFAQWLWSSSRSNKDSRQLPSADRARPSDFPVEAPWECGLFLSPGAPVLQRRTSEFLFCVAYRWPTGGARPSS